jgi:hypothetical protein
VIVKATGTASADVGTLQVAGLEIEIVNDRFGLVQGWIADAAVQALADLDIVKAISPAWPAEHTVGSVTSEGDHASRADLVRQLGYDGTGVVVGVISGGIDSLANAQATGDLGAVTVPPGCQDTSGNDEGTAMLEIVHDLAPGASLLFSSDGNTPLEFINAVNCLKDAGADVIVDDVVFFNEPAFEDGPIAQTVREAVQAGVSYFTSAGNFAQVHVEQPYCAGPDALHDFDCGTGTVAIGMIVPPGGQVVCVPQWNDQFGGSANDYDLLAVDTLGDLLAASFNLQDGTQDPFELLAWANPLPFSVEVLVGITLFNGEARLLDLFCPQPSEAPGSLLLVNPTRGGSIFGHAAMSVLQMNKGIADTTGINLLMLGLGATQPAPVSSAEAALAAPAAGHHAADLRRAAAGLVAPADARRSRGEPDSDRAGPDRPSCLDASVRSVVD